MSFRVEDLQAVEPDALERRDGIVVTVHPELDGMGFNTVDVEGPTRDAVVEYVRSQWGEEDPAWFAEYVVARVRTLPVSTTKTLREFAGVDWIDDGYAFMAAGATDGWRAVSAWGKDGWDLGDWPYVVVLFRDLAAPRDECTVCGRALSEQTVAALDADIDFVEHAPAEGGDRHFIARMPRYERAIYVEGDIVVETFASAEDREAATDETALFYWTHQQADWIDRGDDLKGPYRRGGGS